MSYAPVNNILVLRGKIDAINAVLQNVEIKSMFSEITKDKFPAVKDTPDYLDNGDEYWIFYETDGEPHEEFPKYIKDTYPELRVFFSSVDYDEWCFAYYKEFGVDAEYNYSTTNDQIMEQKFNNFVKH